MPLLLAALVLTVLLAWLPVLGTLVGAPWASLAVTFALVPLLDAWIGPPRRHVPVASFWARTFTRLQAPLLVALLAAALLLAARLDWTTVLVLALSVGVVTGGTGITVAHELGHRASRLDRALARVLLVLVGYAHFTIEHNRGHHVRVATPADPVSAPRGMSAYRFWARSIGGQWRHAWRLEALRLEAAGAAPWSLRNRALTGALASLLLAGAIGAALGPKALVLFAVQALMAVTLLELVNYIEHYGLQRRRLATGGYEPVGPAQPGTPTSRCRTGCCSTCSCTPTITCTWCGRSRRCAACRRRRNCRRAIRRCCWPRWCRRCGSR